MVRCECAVFEVCILELLFLVTRVDIFLCCFTLPSVIRLFRSGFSCHVHVFSASALVVAFSTQRHSRCNHWMCFFLLFFSLFAPSGALWISVTGVHFQSFLPLPPCFFFCFLPSWCIHDSTFMVHSSGPSICPNSSEIGKDASAVFFFFTELVTPHTHGHRQHAAFCSLLAAKNTTMSFCV